jgi:hypothetical protein
MATSPGYGTNFTESEIVLAATADDYDEVRRLLDGMLPGDLAAFLTQLNKISDMAAHRLGLHIAKEGERQA